MDMGTLRDPPTIQEPQTDHRRTEAIHCDCQWIGKRYVVSLLMSLGFAFSFGAHYLFGTANIGFHSSFTPFFVRPNFSASSNYTTQEIVDLMRSTWFWGELIAQLPAAVLAYRYPGTWIFGFSVATLGCLNLLVPISSQLSSIVVASIRTIQGIAEAMMYPSAIAILRWWAPANERSRLLSLIFCGSHFGAVIFILLSRWAFDIDYWQPLAYIFGVFAMIWHIFWVWIVYEKPSVHPNISSEEKLAIEGSQTYEQVASTRASPWCGMLTSVPVYAIIVANVCYSSAYYLMLPDQRIDQMTTPFQTMAGDWAFVPHLVLIGIVMLCGELSDLLPRKRILSTTVVRKIFIGVVFLLKAVAIVVSVMLPLYTMDVIVFPMIVFFISGFDAYIVWAVLYLNFLEIAPKYAAVLVAISNTLGVSLGIAISKATLLLFESLDFSATYSAQLTWILAAAMLTIGAIYYCVFASAEIQPWALPRKKEEQPADECQAVTSV